MTALSWPRIILGVQYHHDLYLLLTFLLTRNWGADVVTIGAELTLYELTPLIYHGQILSSFLY